jgi:hypothetical protein
MADTYIDGVPKPSAAKCLAIAEANALCRRLGAAWVVIAAQHRDGRLDVTTWGKSAPDKIASAESGDQVAHVLAPDVDRRDWTVYSDFRLRERADWEVERERLHDLLAEVDLYLAAQMLGQSEPAWMAAIREAILRELRGDRENHEAHERGQG